MNRLSDKNNLTIGRPSRVIFRFMLPILLGNLLQLTYNIADTRIVGSFLGDTALAGVGATAVVNTLFIGFFMGIANGFAITISHFFGAGKLQKVTKAFASALILGIVLAVILAGGTVLFLNPFLRFLNVPENLMSIASGYLKIILLGMIITMIYDVLLASSRAVGDSVTPLMILILSVVLNIIGDLFLIGVMHTSVRGAAVATVAAQAIALVVCAIYLLRKYSFFRVSISDFSGMEGRMAREMLTTGLSMGFMSSFISIGSMILQTAINGLGDSYIVAQSSARKITEVFMSVFVAVGQTLATFCGQNYGAGRYDRIKEGMRFGYLVTCLWCIPVLIAAWLFSPLLIGAITGSSDEIMIAAASKYLRIDTILYFLVAIIMVQRNSLQGMGDKITPLISSGIEMIGKVFLTCSLVRIMGYNGVILVEPIVWIVMVIPLTVKVMRIKELRNS